MTAPDDSEDAFEDSTLDSYHAGWDAAQVGQPRPDCPDGSRGWDDQRRKRKARALRRPLFGHARLTS